MRQNELVDLIEARGAFASTEAAHDTTQTTLHTLGERIAAGQAEQLAKQLPDEFAGPLLTDGGDAEPFSPTEFVDRVDSRADADTDDPDKAVRAVLETMGEEIDRGEWSDVTEQLPPEYEPLLGNTGRVDT